MRPKKSLGQNFLNNESILTKIVDSGNIEINDIVLEIGPGTGNLTKKILEKKPKLLIVVEKDKDLSLVLKRKYGEKIEIINKDILSCYHDFKFDRPIKVFGNLPYNISTQILTSFIKLKDMNEKFQKFVFIFQKEVAERILANENSKNYGRLSIITYWKMNVKKVIDIDPKYFNPVPKVWSTLLLFTPKLDFKYLNKPENLEHITNIFFSQRRKMIKKPMKQIFSNFNEIADKMNIDLNLRPQNISKNKYLEICKIYDKLHK